MVIVARYFNWRDDKMNQWFEKMDMLQTEIGLQPLAKCLTDPAISSSLLKNNPDMACPVCYDDLTDENSYSLECGHTFCYDCWQMHLTAVVTD